MAIRFQCGACSQPIEVDEEWGLKTVACPYCRKTITAPVESTLTDLSRIPMASPLATVESGTPPQAVYESARGEPPANTIAIVAFALACGVIALLSAGAVILGSHLPEFEQFQQQVAARSSGGGAEWQAIVEYVNARGGVLPAWMIVLGMVHLGALVIYLAAIVCALLGLRRPQRRPFAVAALVISGGIAVFLGAGLF